jgi:hypothetical protein
MKQVENSARFLTTQRRAVVAVLPVSYFAAEHFWRMFSHKPGRSFWYFPQYAESPDWTVAVLNLFALGEVIIFGFALIAVCRFCRGPERVYAVAWLGSILLSPVESLSGISTASMLEGVRGVVMTVAVIAAAIIYVQLRSPDDSSPSLRTEG